MITKVNEHLHPFITASFNTGPPIDTPLDQQNALESSKFKLLEESENLSPYFCRAVFLADHSCASPFGTFLCNSEKERSEAGVREHAVSLWSYLNQVYH